MTEQMTTSYGITGMTCEHCVMSVSEELSELPGVTAVAIELAPGAVSTATVTSSRPMERDAVSAAVEEAGYTLVSA